MVNQLLEQCPTTMRVIALYGMHPGCCSGLTLAAVAERDNLDIDVLLDEIRHIAWRGGSLQLTGVGIT